MDSGKLWLEISAAALEHNLRALHQSTGLGAPHAPAALLAVIKADAYGHGATLCAPVLARAGAAWLGVTDAGEGTAVRAALLHAGVVPDLQPSVLVMCGLRPPDAPAIVAAHLTPTVWLPEHLTWLEAAAVAAHTPEPLDVHLEIDTGMSRQGVPPGPTLDALLLHLRAHPHLRLGGVFTHFSSAEVAGSPHTAAAQRRCEEAIAQILAHGLQPRWFHAGNTATLDESSLLPWLRSQTARLNARWLARAGLALFGHALPIDHGSATLAPHLRPVATWKTRILALSDVPPGTAVGYNATFTAPTPLRLALLPIGYADGLRREFSHSGDPAAPNPDPGTGGWVIVRGQRAPVVGRVSMNLTTVDVTAIAAAALGDEVTLLGPGISAEDHAHIARTIPYEILCAMHGNRILID